MKKLISLTIILVLLVLTVACEKENESNETTTTTESNQAYETMSPSTIYEVDNSEENETKNDNGGGYIESDKYRLRYYAIPYQFVSIVNREEYSKWKEIVLTHSENDTNIMRMVRFVKDFNISKEVFEKTNLQMAKDFAEWGEKPTLRPLDYENQQTYEIYNADIIYTFDDEIINEYYLTPDYPYCADFEYEAAVKRGEYTSQTEEWVDIEQMEAEIIAKYGEAEIVAETTLLNESTTTAISDEITTTEQSTTETTE